MKSLLRLHTTIIQDLGDLHGLDTSRDITTVTSRFLSEGDSFLTITLPSFSDSIIAGVNEGRVPHSIPGFRYTGHLPAFMRGFVRRLFDENGILLETPDTESLRAIRQVCELSKKVKVPVSPVRLEAAIQQFVSTDLSLVHVDDMVAAGSRRVRALRQCFEWLFHDILDKWENGIANFSLLPRHGSGATSEKLSPLDKWNFPSWYESVDEVFPSTLYTHHNGFTTPLPTVSPNDEDPVRIIFVQKTAKSPRIIAIEPSCRQYVQQASARLLYNELRRLYPSQLDLFDQATNSAWAYYGSCTGSVATLDLSEASDRISWTLLLSLIGKRQNVKDALSVSRSRVAELPDGDRIVLRKFASMGSALTFPIQSMVFFAICWLGRFERGARRVSDDISIFGDDIVCPNTESAEIIANLEAFGLKVNNRKSHVTGHYRESCGEEFFLGEDVSIVRLRKVLPTCGSDAELLASSISFRNKCYKRGLWRTCAYLDGILGKCLPWKPVPVGSTSLGRETFLQVPADRWSQTLHRDEIRRPYLKPIAKSYKLDGMGGLLAWFLSVERKKLGYDSKNPFERSERPVAFAIHNRWAPL